jgi:hypothetical protein
MLNIVVLIVTTGALRVKYTSDSGQCVVNYGYLLSDMLSEICLLHRSVIAFVSQLKAQSGECL